MAKDIKFDIEARDGLNGVDALANAVKDFRPKGRNVIVGKSFVDLRYKRWCYCCKRN
jgi:chaperonin GroEL (HSP60 family)